METDIETGEKSYNSFQKGMHQLVTMRINDISNPENNKKNEKLLSEMQQILTGKSCELESRKFQNIEPTIIEKDNTFTNIPESKKNMSFTQTIASLFKRHKLLMNIPIIKNFVNQQLNVLPPAGKPSENNLFSFNNRRDSFNNQLSNNGELKKLPPLPVNEKILNSAEITPQITEEKCK